MTKAAGEKILNADLAGSTFPMVRLTQTVAQSIASATSVALTFTTEDLDPSGFHDPVTNNSRITPTVAGWYRFTGTYFTAAMTTPTQRQIFFRKNGAGAVAPGARDAGAALTASIATTSLIQMNGTTDYVELVVQQSSAGAVNTSVASQQSSVFECEYRTP